MNFIQENRAFERGNKLIQDALSGVPGAGERLRSTITGTANDLARDGHNQPALAVIWMLKLTEGDDVQLATKWKEFITRISERKLRKN